MGGYGRSKPIIYSVLFGLNIASSGVAGNTTISRDTPRTKPAIALQVEGQPLEEARDVPQPVAAPLEHFELVVQPFDKAAGLTADEVVGNQILPRIEQRQEGSKAGEATLFDPPTP